MSKVRSIARRVRAAVTSKVGTLVVGVVLGGLLTGSALNVTTINDLVTGGPSVEDQAQGLADRLGQIISTEKHDAAGIRDTQLAVGEVAERSGCAAIIGSTFTESREEADRAAAFYVILGAQGVKVVPYIAPTPYGDVKGFAVIAVVLDCPEG